MRLGVFCAAFFQQVSHLSGKNFDIRQGATSVLTALIFSLTLNVGTVNEKGLSAISD
jgi:hypothetical protein